MLIVSRRRRSSCISLIVQFPERTKLVEMLTPVVSEEWEHFERVMVLLKKRGFGLGRQRKDQYVAELSRHIRKRWEQRRPVNGEAAGKRFN